MAVFGAPKWAQAAKRSFKNATRLTASLQIAAGKEAVVDRFDRPMRLTQNERMVESASSDIEDRVEELRRALKSCELLYRTAAQDCIRFHPQVLAAPAHKFLPLMLDLYSGLVTKIFIEIVQGDWNWSDAEKRLASELFEQVWGIQLEQENLREALQGLVERSSDLTWWGLVRPFTEIEYLQERIPQLETVVTRLANLIAKFDGGVAPGEIRKIGWIQSEIRRHLRPLELDSEDPFDPPLPPLPGSSVAEELASAREKATGLSQATSSKKDADEPSRQDLLREALVELHDLIGLDTVKHDVQELVNFLRIEEHRAQHGLPRTSLSLHMVFCGNPGTGKTTVARLLGRIFGAMGILKRGHLIETDRSGLVAGYVGQTSSKTHKKIDEALDGVLFIDEAYSLVSDEGPDAYGDEAVQALIKRMEDDRNRLIVILAGYSDPMAVMLASNPGMSSRFSRMLHFDDYTPQQLGRIFERLCKQQLYTLATETRLKLLLGFQYLTEHRDERFGNGRLARNIFEKAIRRLANRIVRVEQLNRDLLTRIEPQDVLMDDVPAEVWQRMDDRALRLSIACPKCQSAARFVPAYLGKTVRCNKCNATFDADWAEIAR